MDLQHKILRAGLIHALCLSLLVAAFCERPHAVSDEAQAGRPGNHAVLIVTSAPADEFTSLSDAPRRITAWKQSIAPAVALVSTFNLGPPARSSLAHAWSGDGLSTLGSLQTQHVRLQV